MTKPTTPLESGWLNQVIKDVREELSTWPDSLKNTPPEIAERNETPNRALEMWIECWKSRVHNNQLTLGADEGLSIIADYQWLQARIRELQATVERLNIQVTPRELLAHAFTDVHTLTTRTEAQVFSAIIQARMGRKEPMELTNLQTAKVRQYMEGILHGRISRASASALFEVLKECQAEPAQNAAVVQEMINAYCSAHRTALDGMTAAYQVAQKSFEDQIEHYQKAAELATERELALKTQLAARERIQAEGQEADQSWMVTQLQDARKLTVELKAQLAASEARGEADLLEALKPVTQHEFESRRYMLPQLGPGTGTEGVYALSCNDVDRLLSDRLAAFSPPKPPSLREQVCAMLVSTMTMPISERVDALLALMHRGVQSE